MFLPITTRWLPFSSAYKTLRYAPFTHVSPFNYSAFEQYKFYWIRKLRLIWFPIRVLCVFIVCTPTFVLDQGCHILNELRLQHLTLHTGMFLVVV
jgi:hypothetical protein